MLQSGNILWATYGAHYLFEYPLIFGMNLKNVCLKLSLIPFLLHVKRGYSHLLYYALLIHFYISDPVIQVVIEYEKYLHSFWKVEAEKFGMFSFMEAAAQPIWEFLGIESDMLRGMTELLAFRFSCLVSRVSFLVSRFSFLVSRFSFLVSCCTDSHCRRAI